MDYMDQFRAALQFCLNQRGVGAQTKIAKKAKVNQSQFSRILSGVSEGSEDTRRRMAEALGYKYEAFLELGQQILEREEKLQEAIGNSKTLSVPEGILNQPTQTTEPIGLWGKTEKHVTKEGQAFNISKYEPEGSPEEVEPVQNHDELNLILKKFESKLREKLAESPPEAQTWLKLELERILKYWPV